MTDLVQWNNCAGWLRKRSLLSEHFSYYIIPLCYNCLQYSVEVCSLAAIGYTIQPTCAVGYTVLSGFVSLHCMTFAQRRNRQTTHFSYRIPVVKRRISVLLLPRQYQHSSSDTCVDACAMLLILCTHYLQQSVVFSLVLW